jgi:hypothetical protein
MRVMRAVQYIVKVKFIVNMNMKKKKKKISLLNLAEESSYHFLMGARLYHMGLLFTKYALQLLLLTTLRLTYLEK